MKIIDLRNWLCDWWAIRESQPAIPWFLRCIIFNVSNTWRAKYIWLINRCTWKLLWVVELFLSIHRYNFRSILKLLLVNMIYRNRPRVNSLVISGWSLLKQIIFLLIFCDTILRCIFLFLLTGQNLVHKARS